jgi:hypothetical protein
VVKVHTPTKIYKVPSRYLILACSVQPANQPLYLTFGFPKIAWEGRTPKPPIRCTLTFCRVHIKSSSRPLQSCLDRSHSPRLDKSHKGFFYPRVPASLPSNNSYSIFLRTSEPWDLSLIHISPSSFCDRSTQSGNLPQSLWKNK